MRIFLNINLITNYIPVINIRGTFDLSNGEGQFTIPGNKLLIDCGYLTISLRSRSKSCGGVCVLLVGYHASMIGFNGHNMLNNITVGGNVADGITVSVSADSSNDSTFDYSAMYNNWNYDYSNK